MYTSSVCLIQGKPPRERKKKEKNEWMKKLTKTAVLHFRSLSIARVTRRLACVGVGRARALACRAQDVPVDGEFLDLAVVEISHRAAEFMDNIFRLG